MNAGVIRELRNAQPFTPFRLHTGSGRHADVFHPEFLSLSPSGRTAVVFAPDDRMEIIDVLMIQSIEMLPHKQLRRKRKKAG